MNRWGWFLFSSNPTEVGFCSPAVDLSARRGLRGDKLGPRIASCRAVETTARSQNPTFVGLKKKTGLDGGVVFLLFQPHEGGVSLSSRGFNRPADIREETIGVRGLLFFSLLFEPHEGGVLQSSRGFNRRLMVAGRQTWSAEYILRLIFAMRQRLVRGSPRIQ